MASKRILVSVLVLGFIMTANLISPLVPIAVGRASAWQADQVTPAIPPRLSAFINIWLEKNVGNYEPAIAYNSLHDEYLVVWSNLRGGGATTDIYARRVRGDGSLLSNFTITHNANFHNFAPDVAYNPQQDEYLVVWTYNSVMTGNDIWARRIKWNGSDLNLPQYQEFTIGRQTDAQHSPAVAYNSDAGEYLVVYQNTWSGGGQDIDAERVRASDGAALGWVNIAAGGGYRSFPDVAYNAASKYYMIAYTFRSNTPINPGDIYGKAVSWNIGYLSSEHHICDDANDQDNVTVAASGGEFLAIWEDSSSLTTTELYARRLGTIGTPLGPGGGFWITGSPGRYDFAPSVAGGSGHDYLVVWVRFMGGIDYNVYGRFARPGLDIGVGSEFALDNDVKAQMAPAVACASNVHCLMAEEDNNSVGGDFEIRGRLVWPYIVVYLPLVLSK
jgi:hypothetical protein